MIEFDIDDVHFNFRTSAIVISHDEKRILMTTKKDMNYYTLPGGRVQGGEDTSEAIRRRFKEELGIDIEVTALKLIIESFFKLKGKDYHELQYFYVIKVLDEKYEGMTEQFEGQVEDNIYEWINIDDLDTITYRPASAKRYMREVFAGDNSLKHCVLHE
jgi:8-oxo-dGTP pyrophosphatase MutT (NUDIX family)